MDGIKFFDCNCSFGRRAVVNPGSFHDIGTLVEKMEYYGIDNALVYHSLAREYDPLEGNRLLLDEIKPYANLEPVWTVMPHYTFEFPEPVELMKDMKAGKIKVVTMFPSASDQFFSMADWNCGELLDMLEKHRIPLRMGMEQFSSFNEMHDLCERHSDLPVILVNVNYRINRNLYSILKKFRNLYIETGGYKVHRGIEEICSLFGAQRLVFGSGMPVTSGAAAVSMINYAGISRKEKEMIASLNLLSLLGGVRL